MLHIVNGDGFAAVLAEVLPDDDEILVWRESLYEGPISPDFTDPPTRRLREAYFAERGLPLEVFRAYTAAQEERLNLLDEQEEAVLWFEHDLYDQTMLVFLLDRLASRRRKSGRLHLLCIDSFPGVHPFKGLGQLRPQQTASLLGQWREITEEQLLLGSEAWRAYASDDPKELELLLQRGTSVLPYLRNAFLCHLQRFPSVHNGLSAVQQAALQFIRGGVIRPIPLFQSVGDTFLEYGLSDAVFMSLLKELAACEHPLIEVKGTPLPDYRHSGESLSYSSITLTPFGQQVLTGHEDHIRRNGIDAWFGGCRLTGNGPCWRWDGELGRLVWK
ncbi:DUF1835 domain-containing protein [Paenibacillus sp. P25]|nr:DUF1835 domain-containing protein [Paenibacillus sp. P25]